MRWGSLSRLLLRTLQIQPGCSKHHLKSSVQKGWRVCEDSAVANMSTKLNSGLYAFALKSLKLFSLSHIMFTIILTIQAQQACVPYSNQCPLIWSDANLPVWKDGDDVVMKYLCPLQRLCIWQLRYQSPFDDLYCEVWNGKKSWCCHLGTTLHQLLSNITSIVYMYMYLGYKRYQTGKVCLVVIYI